MAGTYKEKMDTLSERETKAFLTEMIALFPQVKERFDLFLTISDKESSFDQIVREKLQILCNDHNRLNSEFDYGYDLWYPFGDELEALALSVLESSETANVQSELFIEIITELTNRNDSSRYTDSEEIFIDILLLVDESDHDAEIKERVRPNLEKISRARRDAYLINDVARDFWKEWASSEADINEVAYTLQAKALDSDSSWDVDKYCDFLKTHNRESDIVPFLESNRKRDSIRERLINGHVENEEYEKAEMYIREVYDENTFVYKWNTLLLKLGEVSGNSELCLEAAEAQFNDYKGFEGYKQLRMFYPEELWNERSLSIITELKQSHAYANKYILANIYSRESMIDELAYLLNTDMPDLRLIEMHYKKVLETHPEMVLNRFELALRKYVDGDADSKRYDQAVETLKLMKTLPGGEAVVPSLVEEFSLMYKRRPKFVSLLCHV